MGAALKKVNVESLLPQLTQFGLNPSEWEIETLPRSSTLVRLKHRDQEEFRMTGVYAGPADNPIWNEIYLTSI